MLSYDQTWVWLEFADGLKIHSWLVKSGEGRLIGSCQTAVNEDVETIKRYLRTIDDERATDSKESTIYISAFRQPRGMATRLHPNLRGCVVWRGCLQGYCCATERLGSQYPPTYERETVKGMQVRCG